MMAQAILHWAPGGINFCVPITTFHTSASVLQHINPCILLDSENKTVYLGSIWLGLFSLENTLHHNPNQLLIISLTLLIPSS